jgi:predicted nucleic acid-binding protein
VLLDTGALFAALHQAHSSHDRMSRWIRNAADFATCGLTQIGAFRLLLNDAAMNGSPLEPAEAHEVISQIMGNPRHRFIPCPEISKAMVGKTTGHNAALDDYLVQIAQEAGMKLATLDTRLATRWREETYVVR